MHVNPPSNRSFQRFLDPRYRTVTLMTGILVVIALIQLVSGMNESVLAGALIKPLTRNGQWWRIFTSAFLHGSFLHIVFNAYALMMIGRLLELLTNRGMMLCAYFLAIVTGGLASMFFMPESTSLGASGGILGLFGFLAVLVYKRRAFMPPGFLKSILHNLALIAIIGLIGHSFIDNASHAGGLFAGVIFGWLTIPAQGILPIRGGRFFKVLGDVLFVFYIICALFTLFMIAFVHSL